MILPQYGTSALCASVPLPLMPFILLKLLFCTVLLILFFNYDKGGEFIRKRGLMMIKKVESLKSRPDTILSDV